MSARLAAERSAPLAGIMAMQASAGNAAVVQMLRQTGHPWAQEQHQHSASCGHQHHDQTAPAVQRSTVHDVLRTPGQPMDAALRTDMEGRLGADFSDVRIHDDTAAKTSAAEVGARAYTSGNHIVIGDGGGDRHTLAHELTHVIQQRRGPVAGTDNGGGLKVSDPSDRFEREAEANALRAMSTAAPAGAVSARGPAGPPPAGGEVLQRMPASKKSKKSNRSGPLATAFNSDIVPYAHMRPVVEALVNTHGWKPIGGNASFTLHLPVQEEGATPEQLMTPKVKEVYEGTSNERPPRVFDNKALRAVRWICTTALRGYEGVEVQASIAAAGSLYISTNENSANRRLREVAEENPTVHEFVAALLQAAEGTPADARQARHADRARVRIVDVANQAAQRWPELAELRNRTVHVAPDTHAQDGHHAERRIEEHFAQEFAAQGANRPTVHPENTAGTKRPCVACYMALYQRHHATMPTTVGAGWFSKNAWEGVEGADGNLDADGLAVRIHNAVLAAGGTKITLCRDHQKPDGKPWDHGSDSESENELAGDEPQPTLTAAMDLFNLGSSQAMEE